MQSTVGTARDATVDKLEHQTVTEKGKKKEWNRKESAQRRSEFEAGYQKLKRINNNEGTQGAPQNTQKANRVNVESKSANPTGGQPPRGSRLKGESTESLRERQIQSRANIRNAEQMISDGEEVQIKTPRTGERITKKEPNDSKKD